ncbi:MAG: hypothetical protein RI935_144 [Candidatus Parcubacteria bacterium]|jgi:glucose/mannose-6-phosphate isomerase
MNIDQLLQPLRSFKDQFLYNPTLVGTLPNTYDGVIVCGMGGSLIAARMTNLLFPELPISFHNSYGIPKKTEYENPLFILSSFSGNTEEIIDTYTHLKKHSLPCAIISCGGKLLELAKIDTIPYIELPKDTHLEPRFSLGYQMISLLSILEQQSLIERLRDSVSKINTPECEQIAETLVDTFKDSFLVFYSSEKLSPLSYTIKAALNEGAKIPAFINILPEANHNELQSFIMNESQSYNALFGFFFLSSPFDHERITKRVDTMKALYEEKSFICETFIVDETKIEQVLSMLYIGYAYATLLAHKRNVDPYQTPFIKAFKESL